jgi:hypothetical protein
MGVQITSPNKRGRIGAVPSTSRSEEEVFVTPRRSVRFETGDTETEDDDDDDDANTIDENVRQYGQQHFGALASPYLTPYLYNRRFLDKVFGIRREETDGTFMIGNSSVTLDDRGNIIIQGKQYRGTPGLWELLTRKNVKHSIITTQDLKTYKRILELTSGHLENHDPSGNIKTTRGTKFKEVVAKLFPHSRRRGVESSLRRTWVTY